METWIIALLYMLGAIVGALIIEKTKRNSVKAEGSCSCLTWGSSAHPSGVRRIADANCPIHKEG